MKAYIRENALESRVKILHNVPNEDLPAIYQMAEACVYPSRYELRRSGHRGHTERTARSGMHGQLS